MIKAVLWDFGGVITTSPFDAFNRYEAARSLPRDFIRETNAINPHDNAWARFESNQIDRVEFDRAFAEETGIRGHEIPGREVLALLAGDLRPRMVRALEVVSQHFKTACLTNNVRVGGGPAMQTTSVRASEMAAVMEIFDVVVESSVEGVRKPDPAFYRLACRRLEIDPSEAVFLDDLGVNLKPAREMGMTTIKVIDPDDALTDLAQVLALDLT